MLIKFLFASQRPVSLIFVLFAIFSVILVYVIGIDLISNDGAQYLSTAKNLSNGNGLSTSVLYYDQHFETGLLPAPQGMWPPAYPVFLSFVALFTEQVEIATVIVNLILHGISGWLLYGLVLRTGASERTAFVSLIVFFFVAQGWVNALELRTESLFAVVSLAVLRFLPNTSVGSGTSWFFIGAGTGLATAIRYVGIIELVAVLVMLLGVGITYILSKNWTCFVKTAANGLLVTLGASLFIVPTLVRNILITESILPRSGEDVGLTLIATLSNFANIAAGLSGFSAHGSLPNEARYSVFIVFIVSILVLAGWQCIKRNKRPHVNTVVQVSIWCSIFSLILYLWSSLTNSPTTLNVRYLYTWMLLSVPFFIWLLATGKVRDFTSLTTPKNRLSGYYLTFVLSVFVFGQVDFLISKRHQLSDIAYLKNSIEAKATGGLAIDKLAFQCTVNGGSLLTNRSQQLHRLLRGVPMIGMAKSRYTSTRFDSIHFANIVEQYRVATVILYTKEFAARVSSDNEQQRIGEIINKLGGAKSFVKVYDDGSAYVFRNTTFCPESV